MPYKNPEDKRQWEREHREERNARRRMQGVRSAQIVRNPSPDPVSDQKAQDTWKTILGWAIGIGVVLLLAIGDQPARIATGPALDLNLQANKQRKLV